MFKKLLLPVAIAGVTLFLGGNHADASVSHSKLVNLANNNPGYLNSHPVQKGAYNITFKDNGNMYHFESNGKTWSWSINQYKTPQNHYVAKPKQLSLNKSDEPMVTTAPTENKEEKQQQVTTSQVSTPSVQHTEEQASVGVNSHLQLIKQRESGGDYSAVNASSGASGAYQIMDSTWSAFAPSQYKGMKASQAPKAVQDSVAQKIYNEAGASQWVTA